MSDNAVQIILGLLFVLGFASHYVGLWLFIRRLELAHPDEYRELGAITFTDMLTRWPGKYAKHWDMYGYLFSGKFVRLNDARLNSTGSVAVVGLVVGLGGWLTGFFVVR